MTDLKIYRQTNKKHKNRHYTDNTQPNRPAQGKKKKTDEQRHIKAGETRLVNLTQDLPP